MKNFIYLLFAVCYLHLPCSAQIATISDDIFIRNDDDFKLIGKVEDRYFVVKDQSDGAKVFCFDAYLKLMWENDIETEKSHFKVLGTISRSDYYGIILQFKKKGSNFVEFQKFDENGALIDKSIIKEFGQRVFSPKPIIVRSKNKKKFVLFNDKTENLIEATSFDTEKMEIIWDELIPTNQLSLNNELYQLVVSDSGTLYTVMYKYFSKSNKDKNKFTIFQINSNKKSITEVPFKSNILYDAFFDYDNLNNVLLGSGLYDSKKNYRASGYFHLKMPSNNMSNGTIKFGKFPLDLMTTIIGKEAKENDSFNDAYINELILKSDGGLVMVVERYKKLSHAHTTPLPRSASAPSAYNAQAEYHYDDIILVNMDKDGNANWEEVLYKRQFSRDDGGNFSSFFIMKNPKQIRFIYNDEIKSNNVISGYTLKRDGQNKRKPVLDTDGYDINLMFKNGIQTSKNEIIIPSYKRKSLKLVRIKYNS